MKRSTNDIEAVAALEDDLRRRLYASIRERGRPTSREEAARDVGISRKLAAFHLDKLVDRGLLQVTFARPPGRSGRGAGRSAKYYAPTDREFSVAIPERSYDVMGSILVQAIEEQHGGGSADTIARRVARGVGERIGREERERRRLPPPGAERAIAVTTDVLSACGYEPYADDEGTVRMRNCPFHTLAQSHRDTVCPINRELVDGIVSGLGNETLDVELDPAPGDCCVALRLPARSRPRA